MRVRPQDRGSRHQQHAQGELQGRLLFAESAADFIEAATVPVPGLAQSQLKREESKMKWIILPKTAFDQEAVRHYAESGRQISRQTINGVEYVKLALKRERRWFRVEDLRAA